MVQIVTSVMNTFVHVVVDSPDCVEMGSNARRRASSTPARVTLDAAENEKSNAHVFGAHGLEEVLLLPHDDNDHTSLHTHPGSSPLDVDVEGISGGRVTPTDIDDDPFWGLSVSQTKDETATDLVDVGMDFDDTLSEDMKYYSAFYPSYGGLTYGAQLQNANYTESLAHILPGLSAASMTPHDPAQHWLFNTVTIPPREAQIDSYMQSCSGNSPKEVLYNEKHERLRSEEKRTTVILNNIPLRYTSSKLMHTIDCEGFAGMYDFIYLPMSAARSAKGYAFVNWVNPSVAQRFLSAFKSFTRWSTTSQNVGQAEWAKEHHGLQTNIDRYRNSTVLRKTVPDEYKPKVFQNGEEIPFPPPTRKPSKRTRRVVQPPKNNSQQIMSL